MTDKHIFSSPDGLVLSSLRGAVTLNPALHLCVYIAHPDSSTRIALVAGGGAGHEPAHAGYTGRGMLTASVSGDIFASPSAKQILSAISFAAFAGCMTQPRDVLVIINNYTGDRLNFGLAIEQARSRFPNLNITHVLNADDISLLPQTGSGTLVGPRGLAGNILVCKVLGAYTTFGAKGVTSLLVPTPGSEPILSHAKRLGDALVAHLRSIGATLGHCHVPGREPHSGTEIIDQGFVELGLGLHNEPGVRRVAFTSPTSLISEMVKMIHTSGLGWNRSDIGDPGTTVSTESWIRPGDEVVLFINNLGGISQLEMGAIVETARVELNARGIFPARIYSAPFMTSLNAPGFSVSLVNVTRVHDLVNMQDGEEIIDVFALLDSPTEVHAWTGVHCWPSKLRDVADEEAEAERTLLYISSASLEVNCHTPPSTSADWEALGFMTSEVQRGVRGACRALLDIEKELTNFDTVLGDGDCGETFARGSRAILSALDTGVLDATTMSPTAFIAAVGDLIEGNMGGTIGALFSIFFAAWSTAMREDTSCLSGVPSSQESALSKALVALNTHTPARPGDRTIVDALAPLCTLSSSRSIRSAHTPCVPQDSPQSSRPVSSQAAAASARNEMLAHAAMVVREGAESTRYMCARLGRAAYLRGGDGDETFPSEGLPDPGAWGIAALVEGFVKGASGGF